jgi:ATP-binding cassette subfamily B protein
MLSRIFLSETDECETDECETGECETGECATDECEAEPERGTGVVLSGGQWQRLALARTLMRDGRDLLILDEPSSGLDAEAEYAIHQSLRAHRAGATSVLISHRLGAVRDADHIAVLKSGRIVEQGSHRELLAVGGEYARLFRMQADGYRTEPGGEPVGLPL